MKFSAEKTRLRKAAKRCMKKNFTLLLLFLGHLVNAQYPFEIYPKIDYQRFEIKHCYFEDDSSFVGISNFVDMTDKSGIRIEFHEKISVDSSNILIYRNHKLVQEIIEPSGFYSFIMPDTLYIGDLNNDGIMDVKLFCFNPGCGLAAYLTRKIYLIGRKDKLFDKYSFIDFSEEIERDFNGDKIYEIFGLNHSSYENHSYWVYDLFNIVDGQFKNVSEKYDYPIMIQHLYRMNYDITNKIERLRMKDFSKIIPDDFDERK